MRLKWNSTEWITMFNGAKFVVVTYKEGLPPLIIPIYQLRVLRLMKEIQKDSEGKRCMLSLSFFFFFFLPQIQQKTGAELNNNFGGKGATILLR